MRSLISALFAFALILVAVPLATAQEGSPQAGGESLLAGLGYPELQASVDSGSLEFPAEVEANRYRLVATNSTEDLIAEVILAGVPDGMSSDDAVAIAEEALVADVPSDDFYSLTFVGGTTTFPGSTNDVILTLAPGQYVALSPQFSFDDPDVLGGSAVSTFEVTGELPELTDPEASVFVDAYEMTIDMPDSVPAGPQLWQVDNSGAFVHLVELNSVEGTYTAEQVQATLNMLFEMPATPGAEDVELIEEDPIPVDLLSVISPGQTTWHEVDLDAGNYIAFCWVSGPGDVPPHALLGMFKVFTVE